MTSKNLFLAKVREDYKRRLWLWLTAVFMFVIFAPLVFMVLIAGIDEATYIQSYGNYAPQMLEQAVVGICEVMLGVNVFRILFGLMFAILAAFSGYYWLDDKIRVDFYVSMPEKKNSRFFIALLNGIVMYLVTSFVGLLLSKGILSAFGYGRLFTCSMILKSFGMCFLFFLGVYFLSILAIMLTGNVFAAVSAIAVLSFYEVLLRAIWLGYQEFLNYVSHMETDIIPQLTPWGSFLRAYLEEQYKGSISGGSYLKLILVTLLFGVLAYLAYIYRPMEATGKTLAFKKMSTPLKILLAIPATVLIGLVAIALAETVNNRYLVVIVFVLAISAIIICAVIEAIFELDVKAILNKKLHWAITAVVAIALFFMFREDVFGIDRYLPDKEDVVSYAFVPDDFMNTWIFLNDDMNSMSSTSYCNDRMYLTDVDSVYELMELSMNSFDKRLESTDDRNYISYMRYSKYDNATVILRTKSGRTILKNIPVPMDDDRAHEIENKIFATKEFVDGYFSVKNIDFTDKISDHDWNEFSNSFTTISLTAEEVVKLIDCYKADLDSFDYEKICQEGTVGTVYFTTEQMRGMYRRYMSSANFNIYPSMTQSMAYLEELGYTVPEFTADEVSSLHVTYYGDAETDYEDPESYYASQDYTYDYNEQDIREVVYEGADVEKILPYITADQYDRKWGREDTFEQSYQVSADISTDKFFPINKNHRVVTSTSMGSTTVYFNFYKDQVPDFVKADLGIE